MGKSNKNLKKLGSVILVAGLFLALIKLGIVEYQKVDASTLIEELKGKIDQKSKDIEEVEREIKRYQAELAEIAKEASTLEGAVKSLELTQNKLLKDIDLTESRMESVSLNLNRLGLEIEENEGKIDRNSESLRETLRLLNEAGESSLVEAFLKHGDIASFWNEVDALQRFQVGVKQHLENLKLVKQILEDQKKETEERKQELEKLKNELASQNRVVEANKDQKQELLKETKNTEAGYQALLNEKRAARDEFERELRDIQAQLQYTLDPSKLPATGSGVLSWPLDNIVVTQYFGNTEFAKGAAYNGQGHNGIDLRAPIGTAVKTSQTGIVTEVNHGAVKYCQYGKWVLIKHNNGLSTLYAHLSTINVSVGQTVSVGEIIGYSGDTGYAIGPHLHFTVYVSEAVQLKTYTCKSSGAVVTIPVAAFNAILDPVKYLK